MNLSAYTEAVAALGEIEGRARAAQAETNRLLAELDRIYPYKPLTAPEQRALKAHMAHMAHGTPLPDDLPERGPPPPPEYEELEQQEREALKAERGANQEWTDALRVIFDLADKDGLDDSFPNPARDELPSYTYAPFFQAWLAEQT